MLFTVAYKRSKSVTVAHNGLVFLVTYGRFLDHEFGNHPWPALDDVKIEEYAEYEGISRAQAFRRQQAFRRCFPKDDIATLWGIVRPLLDGSSFRDENPKAQAVYVGSIKATVS